MAGKEITSRKLEQLRELQELAEADQVHHPSVLRRLIALFIEEEEQAQAMMTSLLASVKARQVETDGELERTLGDRTVSISDGGHGTDQTT